MSENKKTVPFRGIDVSLTDVEEFKNFVLEYLKRNMMVANISVRYDYRDSTLSITVSDKSSILKYLEFRMSQFRRLYLKNGKWTSRKHNYLDEYHIRHY